MAAKDKVYGRYRPLKDISVADCVAMYNLFIQYYDNTPLDVFVRDMSKKTGAFIIYRASDEALVGFSTVTNFRVNVDGREEICFFSGDTVVDRRYWGTTAMRFACFKYIIKQKLLHPFTPLNWYLISMGYRTYLVMANLFPNYYPALEGENPHLKKVARAASQHLFGDCFDADRMMIRFGDDACKLKGNVTPITEKERQVPKIRFFEKMNPHWMDGDEMPCVGAFDGQLIRTIFMDSAKRLLGIGAKKRAAVHAKTVSGAASSTPHQSREQQAHLPEEDELSQAR